MISESNPRFAVFQNLYQELSSLPPALAAELLRARREQDPDVCAALESLLGIPRCDPAPPLNAPPVIPGFAIRRELGRGGMGIVYEANQVSMDRAVALKVLGRDESVGADLARFRVEAEAAGRLQHPNVVQTFDVGIHEGRPFLAMEFCSGGSLRDRLQERALEPKEAAALVESLARAVAVAHDCGVIHRDLKPGNILFDAGNVPKIADFGLARKLDDPALTKSGELLGTPGYMAPEQTRGETGPASDIYALGTILFECLTGRRVYVAPTVLETLELVARGEPTSPRLVQPGIPRDLETICLKCLQKDPRRRYASAAELADDLDRFRSGRPIRARPTSRGERAMKWMRRNPWPTATLGVLLVLSIASVIYSVQLVRQQNRVDEAERQARVTRHLADLRRAEERGDAEQVLDALARASAEGFVPTTGDRLKRARALFALSRVEGLEEELIALAAASPSPTESALISLLHGSLLVGADDAQARLLLDRAAAGPLPPADAAYVRGLLSRRVPDAMAQFAAACAADPRHLQARQYRGFLFLLTGQLDAAADWIDESILLFGDDAHLHLLAGMIRELRTEASAERHWQAALERLPADDVTLIREAVRATRHLTPLLEARAGISEPIANFQVGMATLQANRLVALTNRLKLVSQARRNDEGRITHMPLIRVPPLIAGFRRLFEIVDAMRRSGQPPGDSALAELTGLADRLGEGMSRYVLGLTISERTMRRRRELSAAEIARDLHWALQNLDAARSLPALIDTRRVAWHGYITLAGMLGTPTIAIDADINLRRQAAIELRKWKEREHLPEAQCSLYARIAANGGDFHLAREIIDDWTRRRPTSVEPILLKATIEFNANAFSTAMEAARECLKRAADDPALRGAADRRKVIVERSRQILRDSRAKIEERLRLPETPSSP